MNRVITSLKAQHVIWVHFTLIRTRARTHPERAGEGRRLPAQLYFVSKAPRLDSMRAVALLVGSPSAGSSF